MAKTARHSPIRAAAAATSRSRPKKASSGSKGGGTTAKRGSLAKAASAVNDVGSMAVEAVKDIAHKGEELVAKVLGNKSAAAGSEKGGAKKK